LAEHTVGCDCPYHPKLQQIADEESDEKTDCLASVSAFAFEYPRFIAQKRVGDSGDIAQNVAHIEVPA